MLRTLRLIDMWYWFDPFYPYGYGYGVRMKDPGEMGFFEAVGSFLWGDGDPNKGFADVKWAECGRYIQDRGGVVAPIELAQFSDWTLSDIKMAVNGGETGYATEALVRLQGEPAVVDGELLFVFPELQATAGGRGRRALSRTGSIRAAGDVDLVLEHRITLTRARMAQRIGAIALGAWNFAMVAFLTVALRDPQASLYLGSQGLGLVAGALPALQVFSVGFFVVPLARWLLLKRTNAAIADRNRARQFALDLVASGKFRDVLAAADAASSGSVKILTASEAAYSTERPLSEQKTELDEFDRRLERSASARGGETPRYGLPGKDPETPRGTYAPGYPSVDAGGQQKPQGKAERAEHPDPGSPDPEPSAPPASELPPWASERGA